MEFDKSRCYSAINADELKPGDRVIVADNLADLKTSMQSDYKVREILSIHNDTNLARFEVKGWGGFSYIAALAYLVEKAKTKQKSCSDCSHVGWASSELCFKRHKIGDANNCIDFENVTKKYYRPFRDINELQQVWGSRCNEGKGYILNSLDMPHIWIRQKECSKGGLLITYFGEDEVKTDVGFMTMSKLLRDYTFTDGSPCGVVEE